MKAATFPKHHTRNRSVLGARRAPQPFAAWPAFVATTRSDIATPRCPMECTAMTRFCFDADHFARRARLMRELASRRQTTQAALSDERNARSCGTSHQHDSAPHAGAGAESSTMNELDDQRAEQRGKRVASSVEGSQTIPNTTHEDAKERDDNPKRRHTTVGTCQFRIPAARA